jgi:hypothetical protein
MACTSEVRCKQWLRSKGVYHGVKKEREGGMYNIETRQVKELVSEINL